MKSEAGAQTTYKSLSPNFQRKHGKKVPLPKIYADEDSSDSEGLELEDGTRVGRKATGGSGGSGGGKPGRNLWQAAVVVPENPVVVAALGQAWEAVVLVVQEALVEVQAGASSMAEMMMTPMMTLTSEESQVNLLRHQGTHWSGKNLKRASLHMVDSTSVLG